MRIRNMVVITLSVGENHTRVLRALIRTAYEEAGGGSLRQRDIDGYVERITKGTGLMVRIPSIGGRLVSLLIKYRTHGAIVIDAGSYESGTGKYQSINSLLRQFEGLLKAEDVLAESSQAR